MKKYLFPLLLASFLLIPGVYADEGSILISEVLTDPLGADTGKEFVELVNTSVTARDISGWELDPDQLPYFVFPSGTIIEGHGTLTLMLRQSGTASGSVMYTGAEFGSTNMGNAKGSVALFRPGGRDGAYLEDFVQWGEGGQTHAVAAAETGLFDAAQFLPTATEGLSYTRHCVESLCFHPATPSPGTTFLVFLTPDTGSGEVLSPPDPTPTPTPSPRLRLLYVAMNNPSGTADDIGILVEDDGGTGTLMGGYEVRVDNAHFSLDGMQFRTGDTVHIALGSGVARPMPGVQARWSALSGLVATSEQVELYEGTTLVDAVCWFRDPVAQDEALAMAKLQANFWQGDCLPSVGVPSGGVLRRVDTSLFTAVAWEVPSVAPPEPAPTPTPGVVVPPPPVCTADLSSVRLSEFLPNPEGEDGGKEWVELRNISEAPITLCGLRLDDEEGGSTPFALDGYTIAAQSYLLVPDSASKVVLGNTADQVRLLDASGTVIDQVQYESAPSGKSYSRVE